MTRLARTEVQRYLTRKEKDDVLARWRQQCASATHDCGAGLPDPPIVPWCQKLNSIEGLCTIQSCSGHGPDGQGYRSSGHLWLRLSAPMMQRYIEEGGDLAADKDHIERAGLFYDSAGAQVAFIEFRGAEQGKLDESAAAIYEFFRALSSSLVWGAAI